MASSSATEAALFDPEPHHFCDDEPLPALDVKVASPTSAASSPKFTVTTSVSYSPLRILVKFKAPAMSEFSSLQKRALIDVVLILDITIDESRFDIVQNALWFLIETFGPSDRLSIVSSRPARRIFRLRRMTKKAQENAKQILVSSLSTQGSDDFVESLRKGTRILEERRFKNPVACIMVLSNTKNIRTSSDRDFYRFPIYAFGIGPDHDPRGLYAVSAASGGTYSFIPSYGILKRGIACYMGGLLSVVTQAFRLVVSGASEGVQIASVVAGRYHNSISESRSICQIEVGDVFSEEQKQFVISLSLPAIETEEEKSNINVMWFYKDAISGKMVQEGDLIVIRRPMEPFPTECMDFQEEDTRLAACSSIEEARLRAEIHQLIEVHSFILDRIEKIRESIADRYGQLYIKEEMYEMERLSRSEELYETGGPAFALATESSHAAQRPTTFLVLGLPRISVLGFATPNMLDFMIKSESSSFLNLFTA